MNSIYKPNILTDLWFIIYCGQHLVAAWMVVSTIKLIDADWGQQKCHSSGCDHFLWGNVKCSTGPLGDTLTECTFYTNVIPSHHMIMTIPCTNHISVHSSAKFWMFMKQEDPITTSIHHIIFLVSISTITFESGKWCQTFKLIDMKMWGFVDSCTKVIGWWSRFLMFVCMYSHLYKYGRKTCLAWLLTFCTYCSVSWNLFHQKSHECSEIFLKTRVF